MNQMRGGVEAYCERVGSDFFLVQGAGGNVSWKEEGQTLWIKASGKRLKDALREDIFVPVDYKNTLPRLQESLNLKIEAMGETTLRPSIETVLHILFPFTYVSHLHPIELLSVLILKDSKQILRGILPPELKWEHIEYAKPGAPLAAALSRAAKRTPGVEVIFMQNHGVVFGADSLERLDALADRVWNAVREVVPSVPQISNHNQPASPDGWKWDYEFPSSLVDRVQKCWALYPDHVVFLGAEPPFVGEDKSQLDQHAYCFVEKQGLLVSEKLTDAKNEMLRCYVEVIKRIADWSAVQTLSPDEVAELLNWDAEKYRLSLAGKDK